MTMPHPVDTKQFRPVEFLAASSQVPFGARRRRRPVTRADRDDGPGKLPAPSCLLAGGEISQAHATDQTVSPVSRERFCQPSVRGRISCPVTSGEDLAGLGAVATIKKHAAPIERGAPAPRQRRDSVSIGTVVAATSDDGTIAAWTVLG